MKKITDINELRQGAQIVKIQYINKADVIAEINRVLASYDPNEITNGRYALVSLRTFLDTLEVKEVDIEKC